MTSDMKSGRRRRRRPATFSREGAPSPLSLSRLVSYRFAQVWASSNTSATTRVSRSLLPSAGSRAAWRKQRANRKHVMIQLAASFLNYAETKCEGLFADITCRLGVSASYVKKKQYKFERVVVSSPFPVSFGSRRLDTARSHSERRRIAILAAVNPVLESQD